MYQSPKSWPHIKNTVVLTIVTLWHIQCLHLMYAEVAWVLVSSGTQVQPQVILDPDYLPDYLSVSYDYDVNDFLQLYLPEDCLRLYQQHETQSSELLK